MPNGFPNLFSPIRVGKYTLKNRIVNAGHAAHFQGEGGLPSERYTHYLRERARGGVAMIILGHSVIYNDGDVPLSMANYDDRIIPAYQELARATHEFEVPILAQLGHRGRMVVDAAGVLGRPLMAPSALPAPDFASPQLMPHAMDTREVEEVVGLFGAAARRVREGGLDGVEIATGMGYLIAQFIHQGTNRRTDKYGGKTIQERMVFLYEVIDEVRNELGPDLILGLRLYDDLVDYSLGLDDLKVIAPLVEATGKIDYLNVWQGAIPDPKSFADHWPAHYREPGEFAYKAGEIKKLVNLPVIGAGRIDSPALAERLLEEGVVDLVGMVRALIADPYLPIKAREGRAEDIRYCIGTNQSCAGHILIGMGVGCIYNPVVGREKEWSELRPAHQRKRVVVVGGGPAGMEAARVAMERGHQVTLFEKGRRLGGQVGLIIKTPQRTSFEEIILFFERQLSKLGVDVRLGEEATLEMVLREGPDAVVVATGSTPYQPEIPGAEARHVVNTWDVLSGKTEVGERVVVIDTQGRPEGCTVAEFLAEMGRHVQIVTGLQYVGREITPPLWQFLYERLLKKGVVMTPFTGVFEILEDSLYVYDTVTWEPRYIRDIDTVVLAAGGMAEDRLYQQLKGQAPEVKAIGDCLQPRDIEMAVVEGHRVAIEL
ncbi:MAG: FAD-dependent oxidoreductase [Chloroflexi bacterium]|nr:FAD-dependent oxidoreductase [Chloroflexota bacterium]